MASDSNCLKNCCARYVASDLSITDEDYYNQYFLPDVPTPSPEKISDEKSAHKFRRVILSGSCSCCSFKYYYAYSFIWLVLLSLSGFGLIMYGVFQEDRLEYKKLNIAVGLILVLCMLMFISFLMIDTKSLRKYMLHVLIPWCAGIIVIVFASLVAFLVHFINFKLFLITSLPLTSLAFFTFNEIYHYIGRMRVSPMFNPQQQMLSTGEDDFAARRLRTSSRLLQYRPETARRSPAPPITPLKTVTSKTISLHGSPTTQKSVQPPVKQTLPPINSSTTNLQNPFQRMNKVDEETT